MKKIVKIFLLVTAIMSCLATSVFAEQAGFNTLQRLNHDVRIKTHVQGDGWIGPFHEGDAAGTVGQSKRLEALSISVYDGSNIKYRVYVDGLGWSNWANDGMVVGTTGENRAITAIEIQTDGRGSDLAYQVHVAERGWLDWLYAGSTAGDFEHRIEAIRIQLQR